MADTNIDEEVKWEPEVYEYQDGDVLDGGAASLETLPFKQLANRTLWLRGLINGVCAAQGVALHPTQTSQLLAVLDARYFKNSQIGSQATDAELAAAIVDHVGQADPHPQYLLAADYTIGIKHYPATAPLPTANEGPIWHDAYASVMMWRTVTSPAGKGSTRTYTGYVSAELGKISYFAADAVPPGYFIASGAYLYTQPGEVDYALGCYLGGTYNYDLPDGVVYPAVVTPGAFRFWLPDHRERHVRGAATAGGHVQGTPMYDRTWNGWQLSPAGSWGEANPTSVDTASIFNRHFFGNFLDYVENLGLGRRAVQFAASIPVQDTHIYQGRVRVDALKLVPAIKF